MSEPDPIEIAARSLQHRDRSRREIEDRLGKAGITGSGLADALETLERVGYVNDERFATTRAATLAGRGWGDAGIRHDLEGHALAQDVIAVALDGLRPESERAAELAARLGRTRKTAARLARKGFGEDVLTAAFGEQIAEAGL